MRRSAKHQRGRPPPTVRGELIQSQICRRRPPARHRRASFPPAGWRPRARSWRFHPRAGSSRSPRRRERATARHLSGRPVRAQTQAASTASCGIPPQVVIVEPPQPLLQRSPSGRRSAPSEQGRRPGPLWHPSHPQRARRRAPLPEVVGDAPGHRPTVELGYEVRLAVLELLAQQLAEQVVVAIPLASPVEGHHEAVPPLERLERVCRPCRLHHGVAKPAAHAIEHRGVLEKLRLGRRQPGQQLEAEVLGHEPVAAG